MAAIDNILRPMTTPRNPYQTPQAPLDDVAPLPRPAGFPFDLVLRVVIGLVLCVVGGLTLYWLPGQWARLEDRAYIDPLQNPWWCLVPNAALVATGLAMLMRSRYVFIPFGLYAVVYDLFAIRVAGWHQPVVSLLTFGLQLALLSFLLGLVNRNRLR